MLFSRLGLLCLLLLLVTVTPSLDGAQGTRRLPSRAPLVFLADKDYPPLSYLKSGKTVGLDVDIAMSLSSELGREVRVEAVDWTTAQERVLQGNADGLLSMSMTDERRRLYGFTTPMVTHEYGLFVRGGNTAILELADLSGKRVAVTAGGLPRQFLQTSGADLVIIDHYIDGFARLEADAIDAVAADLWVGAYTIEQHGFRNIVRAGAPFATLTGGIAVPKVNQPLIDELDRAIVKLGQDGVIDRIRVRWRTKEMMFFSRGRINWLLTLGAFGAMALLAFGAAARSKQISAQAKHRQAEERLKLMAHALQSASDCITITDATNRILYANEAFLRTYEYEESEIVGQNVSILRSADNPRDVVDGILEATKRDGWRGVIRNRTKSGREFPVSLATSMVKDERGRVIAAVGVARDRASEEAADRALRASEEKYRQVVENAHDIIFTVDREGYCVSMNRAGQDISGFAGGTPRGVHFAHLVVPEQTQLATQELQRVLDGATVPRLELAIISRDGQRLTLEVDVHPIRVGGTIVGAQGIARDVTARKELEAQLRHAQKLEAVGRLAGGVAHDFNNLLTVVSGFTEQAIEQLDPASPVRGDLEEIRRTVNSAASLTRQLLMFSRKSIVRPTTLDIDDMVTHLDKMLRRVVGSDIALNVLAGTGAAHVRADASEMEQVLMNLVLNARDAMPAGGTLTIRTGIVTVDEPFARAHQVKAGEFITIAVDDTGTGMTPDVQAQVFHPFFTTKGPAQGTGLGLATVHGIVRQAGGCIVLDSTPGHGTTFTIHLPRVSAPVEGSQAIEPVSTNAAASGTILFVEDEDSIRMLGARILRRHGYTVLTARHAEDALTLASQPGAIDLLLTDIMMPGLNGRALAIQLRRERPALKVLFTSGYSEVADELQDDDSAFVQKPYTPERLAREVGRMLSRPAKNPD
jgi:two-component system cell cycle sensor histidine kinase/response regulator CckA